MPLKCNSSKRFRGALALQPKTLRSIDINSSVKLAYKDPNGDQTSRVIEDIFGNDLDSFSGYGVEIVKI